MTRFQKIQKLSSVIPVFSSMFVFIVTMLVFRQKRASAKCWIFFFLVFFGAGILSFLVNEFVMTGQHPVLNVIVIGLIYAIANITCVDLQVKCAAESLQQERETTVVHQENNKKSL